MLVDLKTILKIVFYFIAFSNIKYAQIANTISDTIKHQLNQVTVTGMRYEDNIFEVPYAISIINKETLQKTKGYGFDEVMSLVPGVLAQSRAGNHDVRLVIRGFGARGAGDRSNSGTSRGLRIMLDGVPETEPDGRTAFDHIDFSLAQNVEIIKSNSSAIWGNASGGVINVSTISDFNSPFLSLGSIFGSFGFNKHIFQAGTNLDAGKLFVGFTNSNFEGWRERSRSHRSVLNLNFSSRFSDRTKFMVSAVASSNLFLIPGPLSQKQYDSLPQQSNSIYKSRDERRFNRLGRLAFNLEHKLNEMHNFSGMIYVNPKFLQRSERGTFRDFTRYHIGGNFIYRNSYNFSDQFKNIFLAGVDESYQDGAILFYNLSSSNGRGSTLRTNKREGANTFGTFFQNETTYDDKISVIFGGRYDVLTYYSENFRDPKFGLQKKSFEKFTPKFGISYLLNPTHSIYGNIGGGIEIPAGNETDPPSLTGMDTIYLLNPLLEPIISTTFELGTKHFLSFDYNQIIKSLSYDLALYYILIKNDIIPYSGGRFYLTAGETDRKGIELSLNANLNYGLSVFSALTYSINKYINYIVDSVHYNKPNKLADYSGNKVAGIPELYYNITLRYKPEFFSKVYFDFSMNAMGNYFVDDANKIEVPSYRIFNASIGLDDYIRLTNFLSVSVFVSVNNLTDKKYPASAFINPDIVDGAPLFLEPGLPRSFIASLRFKID